MELYRMIVILHTTVRIMELDYYFDKQQISKNLLI